MSALPESLLTNLLKAERAVADHEKAVNAASLALTDAQMRLDASRVDLQSALEARDGLKLRVGQIARSGDSVPVDHDGTFFKPPTPKTLDLLQVFPRDGDVISSAEVCTKTGVISQTVANRLSGATRNGWIQRVSPGRYVLTARGKAALDHADRIAQESEAASQEEGSNTDVDPASGG